MTEALFLEAAECEEKLKEQLTDFFKENCPIPGAKIIIIPGDAYERN